MLRLGAARSFTPLTSATSTLRLAHNAAYLPAKTAFRQGLSQGRRAEQLGMVAYRPMTALIRRNASSAAVPGTYRDPELEKKYMERVLRPEPATVSSSSTMHPLSGEIGKEPEEREVEMLAGIKHDMKVIKQTFALETVPREAFNLGIAGVMPYLFTSLSTVGCAFELHHAASHGSGVFLSEQTAEALLHILEPLQVGYGAVIISFLGAIHWGLEWAGYGGHVGYRRYAIGVIAPAVAWPTILFPVEYALVTQFLAFNLLYSIDSATTVRGWTPPWYSSYRFLLTFIVGASIVVSLIGRGQIADRIGSLPTAASRVQELQKIRAGAPGATDVADEEKEEE